MLNRVTLLGNVGKDPEIRTMQNGKEVAGFTLATSESWKKDGERKTKTEWHRVVVFSEGLVKVIKAYVKKGSKLYIEGQLQTRKWTDKEKKDHYVTEIVLQGFNANLKLLDSKDTQDIYKEDLNQDINAHDLNDEIPF